MTKEQILEKHLPHSWYTPVYPKNSHPIHDKDCLTCKVEDDIFNAMQEYADQELAKERERAAKLVEAAEAVIKSWSERMNNEIEEEKESKIEGIKYWSPSASMVSSSEINKLRQSLTEYKK